MLKSTGQQPVYIQTVAGVSCRKAHVLKDHVLISFELPAGKTCQKKKKTEKDLPVGIGTLSATKQELV